MRNSFVLVLLLLLFTNVTAQEITGYVKNAQNREPVPFVNIIIKSSTTGTMTDKDGFFKLVASENDTICFSAIGYKAQELLVRKIRKLPLELKLKEKVQLVDEVTVKPEIPRAVQILRQIQKHRKKNQDNIKKIKNYKTYANTTAYMAVDSSSVFHKIIKHVDDLSIQENGKDLRYMPTYVSEEARLHSSKNDSSLFYKNDGIFPNLNKAIRSLILINMEVDLDFYKDQVYILERGFMSPICNMAQSFYHIYLNDSTETNGRKYFNFSFAPKNRYDPLFSGHFVVEDSTFALTEINTSIAGGTNFNYVNGFESNITYTKHPDGKWFYDEQKLKLNLSLFLNKDTTKYSSARVENIQSGNWIITRSINYTTSSRLNTVEPTLWSKQPEFSTRTDNAEMYARLEELKKQEMVRFLDALSGAALTGFFNVGKIDIGPFFDVYYTNYIEGTRLSIPLRTSEKFCDRFTIGGFIGYGTKNKAFKYGVNTTVQPFSTDKVLLRLDYFNDYALITQDKFLRYINPNPNNRGNGNFISVLTSREENPYLKEEKSFKFRIEYNTNNEMHFELIPYYQENRSTEYVHFVRSNIDYDHYENYGVLFSVKYGFGQHFDKFFFDRVYYMTPTPILNFHCDVGKTKIPGLSSNTLGWYTHFRGSIQGRLNIGQIFMDYMLNGGYIWGDVPYDLLDQPVGSMSSGFSKFRFNLLHHASFAHNVYSNAHVYFNGGGIIFNKVPGIRKLKLREIVSLKMHAGKLNNSYKGAFDLPDYYCNISNTPYSEIGLGVTNIFKFFRVEYVRQIGKRYSHTNFADKSGIKTCLELSF